MTVNILHQHNGIIHQHADSQDQTEKHQHVQGDPHQGKGNEPHHEREGNRHPHEQTVAYPQKQQQDDHHQQKSAGNVVLQILDHQANMIRLIVDVRNLEPARRGIPVEQLLDLLDHPDRILPRSLVDGHRNAQLSIDSRYGNQILVPVHHVRHIAQPDLPPIPHRHHQFRHPVYIRKLARHPHLELVALDLQIARRDRGILGMHHGHELT